MRQFKISEELATKLLNYLAAQPYNQVFNLINEMQKMEPIQEANDNPGA